MTDSRFLELLGRWQDGDATPQEREEFERLLRSDVGHRKRFHDEILLEVDLFETYSGVAQHQKGAVPQEPRKRAALQRWAAMAWAAGILVMVGLAVFFITERIPAATFPVILGKVRQGGKETARITEGLDLQVTEERSAVIRLAAPTSIELAPLSSGIVRKETLELRQGAARFQIESASKGFTVSTPSGTVYTRGAEFSIELRPLLKRSIWDKAVFLMQVSVTSGDVQVKSSGKMVPLASKESRVFLPEGVRRMDDDGLRNGYESRSEMDREKENREKLQEHLKEPEKERRDREKERAKKTPEQDGRGRERFRREDD